MPASGIEVEERVPGKQGLKLATWTGVHVRARVEERVPGKQGLKLSGTYLQLVGTEMVEERVPGKQGLKLL